MVAKTTRSRKSKGRAFQDEIRAALIAATIAAWLDRNVKNGKVAENDSVQDLKLYTIWNFPKLSEDQLRYPGQLQALVRLAGICAPCDAYSHMIWNERLDKRG